MSLIWDKGESSVNAAIQRFTAGDDVILDRQLIAYDIEATGAHVRGLGRIDVLTADEVARLLEGLDALKTALKTGDFVLDDRFEDGHSAIEAFLTDRLGEVGKKVHTGRSRNDQILVAQRLYLKDRLDQVRAASLATAEAALTRAETTADVPMPGYTHLQRAVPSSLGMWFAAWAEAFTDNAALATSTLAWIDANPLGTAAGYGVNLPLDRDGVTQDLGFARQQINPIYAQNSRGKFELQTLTALLQALLDARRLAWDLSLFTTTEFSFVELPPGYTTGSSIMPNKRNPDVVELLRAATSPAVGAIHELMSLLSLTSGYHRDLQNTKEPVLRALSRGLQALALLPTLLSEIRFDEACMKAAIDGPMHATDRAVELTGAGVPFRDAYRQVAQELEDLGHRTAEESLAARVSPGGCADLGLDELRRRLDDLQC